MKSAMTKSEAIEAMAAILGQLGVQVDLDDVASEAAELASDRRAYRLALKAEAKNWPSYNEERAEDGLAPLTWPEYIALAMEAGEWLERWGTPPEPK